MITDSGAVKLLDFGLAKLSGILEEGQSGVMALAALGIESRSSERADRPTIDAASEPPPPPSYPELPEPTATMSTGGVVKVAAGAPGNPVTDPLTRMGTVMGTPAYMAPEAWGGLPATPMTDVYSLGAVLYELCAGRAPHFSEDVAEIEHNALNKDARPLAEVVPDIDRRFAAIVDRCLRRDPTARPPSGVQVQEALTSLLLPSTASLVVNEMRRRWPLVLLALVAVVGGSLGSMYWLAKRAVSQQESPLLVPRRVVAVLGMLNESGRPDDGWYAAALGELLSREIALGERLRVVAAESVQRMMQESQLHDAREFERTTLQQIRKRLDASIVITGAYRLQGARPGTLQLSVLAQDTETGQTLATGVVEGPMTEVFRLVAQVAARVRTQLGAADVSPALRTGLRVAHPETLKLYGEALQDLRHFRLREAGALLGRVIELDPDFPLAYEALAAVWRSLGYEVRAREALKKAVEHTTGLQREERLLIEARYKESQKEWEAAFATYRTLMRLFPDHLDYALSLGEAQIAAGQPGAALNTLMQLQVQNTRAQVDPRVDAAIARALEDKGEFRAAHGRYDDAIIKGRTIGATLMVARCLLAQSYVKKYLGQPQGVLPNLEAAVEIFSKAGAQLDVADALGAMAWVYRDRGDAQKAMALSHDAVSTLIEAGSGTGTAIHLSNLAILLLRAGELALSTARAEASLALAREVDYKEAHATALVTLGWLDLNRARLQSAHDRAQQAAQIAQEDGDRLNSAWADLLMGETLLLRGEHEQARVRHESALTQRMTSGSNGFVAESRTALAFLALLDHRPADAQTYSRQAVPQFRADGQLDGEAWALAVLSAAHAELGLKEEAMAAATQAEALNRTNPYLPIRATILSTLARTYATLSVRDAAERNLAEVLHLLRDARFGEMQIKRLELSLAVGRLQITLGRTGDAMQTLRTLRAEAERVGVLQIANEASQLCAPYGKGGEPCI